MKSTRHKKNFYKAQKKLAEQKKIVAATKANEFAIRELVTKLVGNVLAQVGEEKVKVNSLANDVNKVVYVSPVPPIASVSTVHPNALSAPPLISTANVLSGLRNVDHAFDEKPGSNQKLVESSSVSNSISPYSESSQTNSPVQKPAASFQTNSDVQQPFASDQLYLRHLNHTSNVKVSLASYASKVAMMYVGEIFNGGIDGNTLQTQYGSKLVDTEASGGLADGMFAGVVLALKNTKNTLCFTEARDSRHGALERLVKANKEVNKNLLARPDENDPYFIVAEFNSPNNISSDETVDWKQHPLPIRTGGEYLIVNKEILFHSDKTSSYCAKLKDKQDELKLDGDKYSTHCGLKANTFVPYPEWQTMYATGIYEDFFTKDSENIHGKKIGKFKQNINLEDIKQKLLHQISLIEQGEIKIPVTDNYVFESNKALSMFDKLCVAYKKYSKNPTIVNVPKLNPTQSLPGTNENSPVNSPFSSSSDLLSSNITSTSSWGQTMLPIAQLPPNQHDMLSGSSTPVTNGSLSRNSSTGEPGSSSSERPKKNGFSAFFAPVTNEDGHDQTLFLQRVPSQRNINKQHTP